MRGDVSNVWRVAGAAIRPEAGFVARKSTLVQDKLDPKSKRKLCRCALTYNNAEVYLQITYMRLIIIFVLLKIIRLLEVWHAAISWWIKFHVTVCV